MAFPESFLQELADRNDIADVVGSYVRLNKRSGSNLFGLCPFHSEKTPSFSVNPDKQIYHCFGCGKGGSVINFIMEIENLSFPDAVEFLARRCGMEVPNDKEDEGRKKRERLLSLNKEAARFFHQQFISPAGAPAREYAARRGLSSTVIKNFGLGYAPESWYELTNAMKAKGYTDFELITAGLANSNKSGKGVHDIFRSRLMFPIIDVRGNVLGFSGRILGDGEPKYLNTRETPVFNKSRNLFALNLAKKSKSGYILLAEGNIDVVSLHQAGFDSAVASLGTSLTPEQARLISRYTNEVVIAYDNDGAGQKAAQRAIGILENLDLKVKVLRMSGAKDPDEFIKMKGADAFKNLLEQSENHVEYRLQSAMSKYNLEVDEEKVAALKEAVAVIASLPNSVEREVYSMRVADKCSVNKAVILDEVERARKKKIYYAKKQQEKDLLRPAKLSQPKDKAIRYENERSALAEEGVIRLLCLDGGLFKNIHLSAEDFSSPLLGRFYTVLREKTDAHLPVSIPSLAGTFTMEEIEHLTGILNKPEVLSNGQKALGDYINIIKTEKQNSSAEDDLRAFAEQMRNRKGYGGQNGC